METGIMATLEKVHHPDSQIHEMVWSELWNVGTIRSLDLHSIDFEVVDGEVMIYGHLARDSHRREIETLLSRIPGVVAVRNDLITDHDLRAAVARGLALDKRTQGFKVDVGCFHGWVQLSGDVPNLEAREAVESVAASCPHVRGIIGLPGVPGEPGGVVRHHLQPGVRAVVYATDGSVGRVAGVVIDPQNRLVSRFLLRARFETGIGGIPVTGEFVLPIETIEVVSEGSVFLNETKERITQYPPFKEEDYSPAPEDWWPPYPYLPSDVRWPTDGS